MNASGFFNEEGLLLTRLIAEMERGGPLAVDHGKHIFRYSDGVWASDGESEIRRRVAGILGDRYRVSHAANVLDVIKNREPLLDDESRDTTYLNLPNGLLNWRTGEVIRHDPKVLNTVRIPVNWNPGATCPAIEKWLGEVLPADAIEFAFEVIGYCLLNDNPLHKAFLLYASGRNGKGTYLHIIQRLLGTNNVSAVSPQDLDDNRFRAAELYGKLANLVGDVDPKRFQATEIFKKLTGQDLISAERKYGHPFTFCNRATIIASFNRLPTTADTTEGFFSRWVVVPFIGYFPEGKADTTLRDKLTTPSELEGLLVRAVFGLRNLMERGSFDIPQSVKTETGYFRRVANPVRAFAEDRLIADRDSWIPRRNLYVAYQEWAEEAELETLTPAKFYEALDDAALGVFGQQVNARKRQGERGYLGMAFRQEQ